MGVPVAPVSNAPANQQHGFELMRNGAAVACGGSFEQGETLTLKVSQALVDAVAADGWADTVGPNYIVEVTNQAILQSGDAERSCSNSRIINAAGDISLTALNAGELKIRMLSAHQYGQVYATNECTCTVTGNREIVSYSGYLALDSGDLSMPWDVTVESLLAATASYTVLEEATEGTFTAKYVLDAASNTQVRDLLEALPADTKNIQVSVMGFAGSGSALEVVSIERCEKDTCDGFKAVPGTQPPTDQICITDGLCVESSVVDEATGMMTTTITSDNDAWFAIGISTTGGGMTAGGAGSDMIVCSEEGVRRFWVTGRKNPEEFTTVELGEEAGGAAEVSNECVFADGTGRMTFTRALAASSATERAIVQGTAQAVIWARGPNQRALSSRHASRGEVALDLTNVAGGVTVTKIRAQWTLWLHLLFMAPAWSFLLPLGAAIANRARSVEGAPAGAWFKVHKALQRAGWGLQLLGFIFAVAHCDKFSAHWQHPHTRIGLALVIIATLQPLNALLRPHPPPGGWPEGVKPRGRVLFELAHKGLGWGAILLGMLNVLLGALLARQLDFYLATWAVPLAIGCTGISAFVLYFGLALAAPNNALNKAITGAKPEHKQSEKA